MWLAEKLYWKGLMQFLCVCYKNAVRIILYSPCMSVRLFKDSEKKILKTSKLLGQQHTNTLRKLAYP
jgi:hypothetical protein